MMNDREGAVGIILKLLDGGTTAETTTARQLTGVIEEVRVALEVGYTTVVGKRLCIFQRHNLTAIGPGAFG